MDGEPGYRLLTRTLRPPRLCALFEGGEGWGYRALRLLEGLSVSWGGSHDLLLSLEDDDPLPRELWKLVELYDPDEWATFATSPRHLQMIGGDLFDRWMDDAVEPLMKQGDTERAAAERMILDVMIDDPLDGWDLPETLKSDIARRTGVATIRGNQSPVHVYMADRPPGGHVSCVLDVQPLPARVRYPDVAGFPIEIQLLCATRWGALSPRARQQLADKGCDVVAEHVAVEDVDKLLTTAWFGSAQWWPSIHSGLSGAASRATFDDDLFFSETPFALSAVGCAQLHRPDYRFDPQHVIVVGSEPRDYSYALGLSRIGVPAIWLPPQLLDHPAYGLSVRRALVGGLRHSPLLRGVSPTDRLVLVRSLSLTRSNLEVITGQIFDECGMPGGGRVEVVDNLRLPTHRIPLLGDPQHFDDQVEEPFASDAMVRRLPALLPSAIGSADPWKLQWWVEVEQPGTTLPGRSALNQLVVQDDGPLALVARCGRNQVSYPSHSLGFVLSGSSLAQIAVRPRLRFPDAATVFRELFARAGYECSESPAGRFRRLATELWGGLGPFSEDLSETGRFAILRGWIAPDPKKDGEPRPPGIRLRGRRYLSLEDVRVLGGLTSTDDARVLVDSYLARDIVRRGFVLKCSLCRNTDWYPVDDLGQHFQCTRCRASNLVLRETWITLTDEAVPFYDLAEVATQALEFNCHVPIGALAALQKNCRVFAEAPELEVYRDGGPKVELDLLVITDGLIGLGEAKKGPKLDDTKKKEETWLRSLVRLADVAHADFVVFATASEDWSSTTRERIESAFPPVGLREVRYFTSCAHI